ncbi:ADP-ribosyltransferase domain-containing protein [Yersinia enterocolitica]|uniref:ADP-ribosyltransferase domain-containing protein n=1 Tax=Yersinia enterocolitica TaxID=630 RepID=UPI0021ADF981|nr:ADP-ribosyltransferase domain-containing protein [Yersinia enterocolitica]
MNINSTSKSISLAATAQPLEKKALIKQENKLGANIKEVNNTIATIRHEIGTAQRENKSNNSLLASLKGIASKHGDDANIRLKNDHFKLGQGSNFLKNLINGGRYKLEQQAAASKLEVKGSVVSAGIGMSAISQLIDNKTESVASYQSKLTDNQTKLSELTTKKADIGKQIDAIETAEVNAEKLAKEHKELRNNFSMIYQSNVGCKAINAEARHQFGNPNQSAKLKGNQVIAEYVKTHGDNVFSGGNAPVKSSIQFHCSNLSTLVKDVAKAWYTPTDTKTTSHRGQGMTQDGINKLITQFNNDSAGSVYKLGQFFSTSKNAGVAKDFADRTGDSVKIMFEVKGNSGRGIAVSNGLKFENNEREVLYSPLACFAVTDIKGDNSKGYTIKLNEVGQDTKAKLLPY